MCRYGPLAVALHINRSRKQFADRSAPLQSLDLTRQINDRRITCQKPKIGDFGGEDPSLVRPCKQIDIRTFNARAPLEKMTETIHAVAVHRVQRRESLGVRCIERGHKILQDLADSLLVRSALSALPGLQHRDE